MMLRKFGFKKAEPKESEARVKLQKELFAYNECATHGFPSKPSTLAYDPKLNLLAVGTKNGKITVVGAPGVEFSAEHDDDVQVTKLFFLPEQGRLISLCSDNTLHLWEINIKDGASVLEEVKKYEMEASKLKTISTLCLTADSSQLLVGTEGGNIHILDVVPFTLSEQIIYQDVVMQNVPDDFKVNPGAVEDIAQHPTEPDKFLIGYHRGLVVLWDNKAFNAEQTYNATQGHEEQLESLSWYRDGTQFMTAHADGSYIVWATNDSTKPKEQANTPYGPFPCKSINKICWKNAKAEPFVIFSGGMPRASYGDRNTVSVVQGAKQVVYDFTSRVVDFVVLSTADTVDDPNKEFDDPQAVIVLAEEEMVAIDLQSENWPTFKQPYLCSLHSSAITCAHHAENIPDDLWAKITEAGEQQNAAVSPREWPVWGGKNARSPATSKDLLLTGHEDGTVRFWDASDIAMKLMYKLQTSNIFGTDMGAGDQANADADEEWPPFRKVGTFDPYSDDPRLGIQKMALCPLSDTLLIGGTSGQVIVLQFERTEREIEVKAETVNIVSDRDNFVWKGHEALTVKSGNNKYPSGFQPTCVMQLHPPAACTALALHSEWQIMAAGTAHGFGVFDYSKKKEVCTKCTLNPSDMTGTSESAMSRRKSFKKSLRESFRRLRKRRSERRKKAGEDAKKDSPKKSPSKSKSEEEKSGEAAAAAPAADAAASGEAAAASGEAATAAAATEAAAPAVETAPTAVAESPSTPPSATTPTQEVVREVSRTIERSIEARSTDDSMASMVRYLYFADTFLINAQSHTPTLWAGTNAGTIFVFQITMPANDKRDSEDVQCILGKEIHLKHRAPVISICIVDRNACPLPAALEVQHERAKAPDMTGSHQVVICSEEQFKIFSLPNLKPQNKYKLTAHEGSKVRRIGFINFRSRSDENYSENDLVVLTNQGDMQVFTVPHLRRQLKAEAIRKENVNGIVSCVFTHNGEGFFPESPSEFVRFSLSARTVTKPLCEVELAEGMRPEPVPEPEPVAETEETPAADADAAAAAGDGADGGDADESKAEADDSMVANESQMSQDLTMDSVKIHLSEASEQMSSLKSEVMQSSSSVVRTVVTRTVVQETTGSDGEPTRVVQSETTTTRVTSQDGEVTGNEKSTVVETSEGQ